MTPNEWLLLALAIIWAGIAGNHRRQRDYWKAKAEHWLSRANTMEAERDYWQQACQRFGDAPPMTMEQHAALWERIYRRIAVKPSPVSLTISGEPSQVASELARQCR